MREVDLFQALHPWLRAATGIEVIEAHSNAPTPAGAYLSVNMYLATPRTQYATQMNYEEAPIASGDGIKDLFQVPVIEMEWVYSLNIYAENSVDFGRRIISWCMSDGAALLLYPLMAQPVERVRRLPEMVENKWQDRSQLDLTIRGFVKRGVITDGDGQEIEIGRIPVDEVLHGTITVGPFDKPDLISQDYSKP